MAGEEPPYLTVGTDVSAKYKGAFCEAKIKKIVRTVKCKVNFNNNNGSALVTDDLVRGTLRVGAHVEAKHPEKNQYLEGIVNKIHDYSQYTVVFDDGDETTLRRTSLCLKSGRHFAESETLDQLPLTHPEHFGTPVMGIKGGRKRRTLRRSPMMGDASSDDETPPPIARRKEASKPKELDPDMGKVVCVDISDKKKQARDNWFPGLVVSPGAQETFRIKGKDEYLVRSFKDGKYHVVLKKDVREFTREIGSKVDNNTLKTAVERAMQYVENDELPPHWDRESLFRAEYSSNDGQSDQDSDSDVSDDEPSEAKDRFVAQLYKFMDDRGTPINKAPLVSNKDLNLYKLFKVVQKSGGYNRVTNQMQWKSVYTKLGLPTTNSSASHQIKSAYKRYLHSFEGFERKLGCTMGTSTRSGRVRHRSERNRVVTRDREFKSAGRRKKELKQGSDDKSKTIGVEVKVDIVDKSQDVNDEIDETMAASDKIAPVMEPVQAKKDRPTTSKVIKDKEAESKSSDTDDERKSKGPPRGGDDSKSDDSPSTRRRGRKKLIKTEKNDDDDKSQDSDDEGDDSGCNVLISDGDKVRVKYGRGRQQKIYEAKVLKTDTNDDDDRIYFVHYTGWNMRYDEWVKRHRIVENLTQKVPEKRFRQSGSKFKPGKRGRPHGSFTCGPKFGSTLHKSGGRSERGNRRGGGSIRTRATRSETRSSMLDSPSFPNGLEPQRRHQSGSSGSDGDSESDAAEAVVRRTRSAKREDDADTSFEEKDKYEFVDDEEEEEEDKKNEDELRRNVKSAKGGIRRLKKDIDIATVKSFKKGVSLDDLKSTRNVKVKQQLRKLRAKPVKVEEPTKKIERRGRKKKQPQLQPTMSDDESDDGGGKDDDDNSQNEGVMDSELYFFESSKKDTTSEAENSVMEDSENCFVSDVMAASKSVGDVSEGDFAKHEDDSNFLDTESSLFKQSDCEPIEVTELKENAQLPPRRSNTPGFGSHDDPKLKPAPNKITLQMEVSPVAMPFLDREEPADNSVEPVHTVEEKRNTENEDRDKIEMEEASVMDEKVPPDVASDVAPLKSLAIEVMPSNTVKSEDIARVALTESPSEISVIDERPTETITLVIKEAVEDDKPMEKSLATEQASEKSLLDKSTSEITEDNYLSLKKSEIFTSPGESSEEDGFQFKDKQTELPVSSASNEPPIILDKFDALLQDITWRKSSSLTSIDTVVAGPSTSTLNADSSSDLRPLKKEKIRKQKNKKTDKRKFAASESGDTDDGDRNLDDNERKIKKKRNKDDDKKESTGSNTVGAKTKLSSPKKSKEKKKSKKFDADRDDTKKSRRKECKRKKEIFERNRGKLRADSDDASSASSSEIGAMLIAKKKEKKSRKHGIIDTTTEKRKVLKKGRSSEERTSDDSKTSSRKDKVKDKTKGGKRKEKSLKKDSALPLPTSNDSYLFNIGSSVGFEPIDNASIAKKETKLEVAAGHVIECNVPSYLICEEDVPASPVGTETVSAEFSTASVETANIKDIKGSGLVSVEPRISAFTPVISSQKQMPTTDPSIVLDDVLMITSSSVVVTHDCTDQVRAQSPNNSPSSDKDVTASSSFTVKSIKRPSSLSGSSNDATPIVDDETHESDCLDSGISKKSNTNAVVVSATASASTTSIVVASEDQVPTTKRRRRNNKKQLVGDSSVVDLPTQRLTSSGVSSPTNNSRHRHVPNKTPPKSNENEEFVHMADMFLGVANSTFNSQQLPQSIVTTTAHGDIRMATSTTMTTIITTETTTTTTTALTAIPSTPAPLASTGLLQPSQPLPRPQLLYPAPHSPIKPSKFNFYAELDEFLDGAERIAVLQERLTELRRTYLSRKAELACIDRRRKKLKRKEKEGKLTTVVN